MFYIIYKELYKKFKNLTFGRELKGVMENNKYLFSFIYLEGYLFVLIYYYLCRYYIDIIV